MKNIFILLFVIFAFACSQSEKNKEAKYRLLNDKDKNPYAIKIEKLNIDSSKLESDMNEFEKALFMSYSNIASKLETFKAKINSEIKYSRAKKLNIDGFSKDLPDENTGASDKKMPPVYHNMIELKQEIDFKHSSRGNYSTKIKNNKGYSKEIKWINQMLFIKSNDEKFSYRKSIEDEHITYKEESLNILKEFFKLNNYMLSVSYIKDTNYENKKVKVYSFKKATSSYKNIDSKSKILECRGEVFLDENYIALKIDLYIKSSVKKDNKEIIKEFKYLRKIFDIGKDVNIEIPEKTFSSFIPPSEEDAEEKILSFKKGHSAIEKLKKKKEKYEKIIGKTK